LIAALARAVRAGKIGNQAVWRDHAMTIGTVLLILLVVVVMTAASLFDQLT
jgi:hypothetical protein